MKTLIAFSCFLFISHSTFSQGTIPFRWSLSACGGDVMHSLSVNNQPSPFRSTTVKIGDTLYYEVVVIADGSELYEISVKYEFYAQKGILAPQKMPEAWSDFSKRVRIPFIISPENAQNWIGTATDGKIYIEVLDMLFKDEKGIIWKHRVDPRITGECCYAPPIIIQNR